MHIIEGSKIKSHEKAGGGGFMANFEGSTVDPMVKIEVMG